MPQSKIEQYVVVVTSDGGEAQAFGPFRNWQKASEIADRIGDADGGQDEVRVQLLSLDRPKASEVNGWVKAAGAWRDEEDEDA